MPPRFLSVASPRIPLCLLVTGLVSFLTGTLVSGPTSAAPSTFLEIEGDIVSSGGLDWGQGATGAGAFAGGLFVGATTPPTAPLATLALTGDPSVLSSQFVVDPLASDSTICGRGDPTAFTGAGGEKNGDLISTMTFGTAAVPPKDDLSNVYGIAHDLGGGNAEVFFGAERVVNNGDSHVDFELLQGVVARGPGCSGGFTGDRSQGDLLVAVDFTNGGALAGTTVYEWHCLAESSVQPADGTVCNPPATGPSVPHYENVSAIPAVAANVIVRVNAVAVPCGGWACRASDGTQITTLGPNVFLEGAINLGGAGFTGCMATLMPHTRTSQSFTSTLKDFTGPIPLSTCRPVVPPTTTSTSTTSTSTTLPPTTTTLPPTTTTTVAPTTTTTVAPTTTTTVPTTTTTVPATTTTVPATTTTVPPTTTTVPATTTTTVPATTTTVAATTTTAPATTTTVPATSTTAPATTTTVPATTTTAPAPAPAATATTATPLDAPSIVAGTTFTRGAPEPGDTSRALGDLPRTGFVVKSLLVWAGLAVAVGGALMMGARRREAEGDRS